MNFFVLGPLPPFALVQTMSCIFFCCIKTANRYVKRNRSIATHHYALGKHYFIKTTTSPDADIKYTKLGGHFSLALPENCVSAEIDLQSMGRLLCIYACYDSTECKALHPILEKIYSKKIVDPVEFDDLHRRARASGKVPLAILPLWRQCIVWCCAVHLAAQKLEIIDEVKLGYQVLTVSISAISDLRGAHYSVTYAMRDFLIGLHVNRLSCAEFRDHE